MPIQNINIGLSTSHFQLLTCSYCTELLVDADATMALMHGSIQLTTEY